MLSHGGRNPAARAVYGWERVAGVAVENLRRLLLRGAFDRRQARANPGERRRRGGPRRRQRQADGFHGRLRFAYNTGREICLPRASVNHMSVSEIIAEEK